MSTPTQIGGFIGMVFLFVIAVLLALTFGVASFWFWQASIGAGLCLLLAVLIALSIYRESKS